MKSVLINRNLLRLKRKTNEGRLISIEILTLVDHPDFPRPGPQENAELLSRLKLFEGGLHELKPVFLLSLSYLKKHWFSQVINQFTVAIW